MFFEEALTMYRGGEWVVCTLRDGDKIFTRFRSFLFKTPLVPNVVFDKLEIVNYLNKNPSQIRLFKNKFAFARNTRNTRQFLNV